MTLNFTVSDTIYPQIAELAAQQQVSVERIVAVAQPNSFRVGIASYRWRSEASANGSWACWTRFCRRPRPRRPVLIP
jgi:hypothetical protein